eukprot:TRINITY_DN65733_c7_g5_i1.p1 TRINITY_DN65733_c7_g5~~TRINITY_DN65733_c7_g5_i1.p1  ORF type:complete len:251 (-),score=135.33 TRINITY_DN65733_c7_g5_i1:36-788(-)
MSSLTGSASWASMAAKKAEGGVAVITAAGRGMGAAIAREFAARKFQVVLMSTSDASVELAKELGGVGMKGSVTKPADLKALVQLAISTYGQIDVVVNNTGHPPSGELLSITDEQWGDAMNLTFMNVVRMARLVVPHMMKNGGTILNITSFSAKEPDLAYPTSSCLRAGLSAYIKLFVQTYGKHGIRMNNVLPGFIDSYPESDELVARIPAGRFGKVEEIAKTCAFLASEGGAYITGSDIRVDGGITLGTF